MRHQDEHIAKAVVHAGYARAAARDALRHAHECARAVSTWNGEGHPEAWGAFGGPLESASDLLISALGKLDHIDVALEGVLRAHNNKEEKD